MLLFIIAQLGSPIGLPHVEPGGITHVIEGRGSDQGVEAFSRALGVEAVSRVMVEVG